MTGQDPRFAFPIAELELTPRGQRGCEQLRIHTIGDFLAARRQNFLALPNCGKLTYKKICDRVTAFMRNLEPTDSGPGGNPLAVSLHDLVQNPRARRAFTQLKIETVGQFLSTPKDEFSTVAGFGDGTYRHIVAQLATIKQGAGMSLLPRRILDDPLDKLDIDKGFLRALNHQGLHRVGDLLAMDPGLLANNADIGSHGVASLRDALNQRIHLSRSEQPAASTPQRPRTPPSPRHTRPALMQRKPPPKPART